MTTKESIHAKIEQLDEERAQLILEHIEALLSNSGNSGRSVDLEIAHVETPVDHQFSQQDAMLALIGMVRSPRPTNIAEHKDEYITDAILHRGQSGS